MNDGKTVLRIIHEYSGSGHLIFLEDYPGAFTRGSTLEQALQKIPDELSRYGRWSGQRPDSPAACDCLITQSKKSGLAVEDADSDILFDSEKLPLSDTEYAKLKSLVLKSGRDFLSLYGSVPAKDQELREPRGTFYGEMPVTASAMYEHVKNVNGYYFAEIAASLDSNEGLSEGREQGFRKLEARADYLCNEIVDGSFGEQWTLRKVMRRFIWHDAIHARAMYRRARQVFPENEISNPFCFPW